MNLLPLPDFEDDDSFIDFLSFLEADDDGRDALRDADGTPSGTRTPACSATTCSSVERGPQEQVLTLPVARSLGPPTRRMPGEAGFYTVPRDTSTTPDNAGLVRLVTTEVQSGAQDLWIAAAPDDSSGSEGEGVGSGGSSDTEEPTVKLPINKRKVLRVSCVTRMWGRP